MSAHTARLSVVPSPTAELPPQLPANAPKRQKKGTLPERPATPQEGALIEAYIAADTAASQWLALRDEARDGLVERVPSVPGFRKVRSQAGSVTFTVMPGKQTVDPDALLAWFVANKPDALPYVTAALSHATRCGESYPQLTVKPAR